jgi:dsDNA-specific endonuclease/ATPase MutS2
MKSESDIEEMYSYVDHFYQLYPEPVERAYLLLNYDFEAAEKEKERLKNSGDAENQETVKAKSKGLALKEFRSIYDPLKESTNDLVREAKAHRKRFRGDIFDSLQFLYQNRTLIEEKNIHYYRFKMELEAIYYLAIHMKDW